MVKIGLIDNWPLFREGLEEILDAIEDFEVVGQADDVDQALAFMIDSKPDVIVLRVRSPDDFASDAVRHLRASLPDPRIVVLGVDDCPELLFNLLTLGINAYLANVNRRSLVSAIRCVLESNKHILLSVSPTALNQTPVTVAAVTPLTPRELEILSLTSQALSNTQIARLTFLAEATVKRHLRNIFTKLGAVSRIDAVNKAVAAQLLPPPPHRSVVTTD